jgi:hypothetical protein
MAGFFDDLAVAQGWFDETALALGWLDDLLLRDDGALVGTLSRTLDGVTSSSTATLTIEGGGSGVPFDDVTSSSTATLAITGTASRTLGALVSSSTATLTIAGTASRTLGALVSSSTATLAIAGTTTATLAAVTADAVGEGPSLASYRRHDLTTVGADFAAPAIEPLTGLRPFVAHPALAVFRAQDTIAAQRTCRIVCSWGLRGDAEWRVPNTDPASATQTHPDRTTWYTVARARVDVTPGSYFELAGCCLPSGETQRLGDPFSSPYLPDGTQGSVRITITWYDRDGGSETTVNETNLPASTLQWGAEDTAPGGFFRGIREFGIPFMAPEGLDDTATLARWSRSVAAEIQVDVQGSPRIIDATISERPYAIALDINDPDDEQWAVSHLFAPGSAYAPVPSPKFSFARWAQRALTTARAQANVLGPVLLQWAAYSEAGAGPTTGIVARTTSNDGTTFESVLNPSHTGTGAAAYNAARGGWSVSAGGYARRNGSNNELVLRDRIAVIPVTVFVYGRGITAGTSTIRVQTALHSYVDVTLPVAGSASWHRAVGYLEVGVSPEQPRVAQVFLRHTGASGSLSVEAVEVVYGTTPAGVLA